MQTVKFKPGDTIIAEGSEGSTAFYIVSGAVEVSVGEGDRRKVLGAMGAGEIFGEMALIEPGPRSATVKATTSTECQATSYDEFVASIQTDPERAVQFMRTLVRRLRQANERLAAADPARRGLRGLIRDWQKSMLLPNDELAPVHWTMLM
jgi:CRP-like cAMP-binding protein